MADRRVVRLLGWAAVVAAVAAMQLRFGLCPQDDAYISFRYARNLVEGHGLVYNPGERVEGYTNFLWTVAFAPVVAAGLEPGTVAAALGMVLTPLLLLAAFRLAGDRWVAAALVAAHAGLALEAVQGLETVFYALLVTVAVFLSARPGRGWAAVAGLSALTRPEGTAVFGLLWLLRRAEEPRERWIRGGLADAAPFLALAVPHLAFRLAYYGDIVPNTFHAKVGGLALGRGLRYVGAFAWANLPLFVGLAAGGARAAARWRPLGPAGRRALAIAAFYLVYPVLVGGDFKGTGRFLVPGLPAMAALAAGWAGPRGGAVLALAAATWSVPRWAEMVHFADRFASFYEERRAAGELLAVATPPDWTVAVHSAGILPYYCERRVIDMWGLTDAHIARAPVEDFGDGWAGHERTDYAYVLSRRPELVLPERGLVTDEPVDLGDPGVFGPRFLELYRPTSLRMDGRFLNAWVRRDALGDGR